jgi:hypothetical protein
MKYRIFPKLAFFALFAVYGLHLLSVAFQNFEMMQPSEPVWYIVFFAVEMSGVGCLWLSYDVLNSIFKDSEDE